MPMTAMPEGKIVCIGGDGGGIGSVVPQSRFISKRTHGLWGGIYVVPMSLVKTQRNNSSHELLKSVRISPWGPFGTVPELLFEKKGPIPAVQQLLIPVCDSMDSIS